jgi:hypothetical protein
MKYLIIENNKGYIVLSDNEKKPLDQITKDDILVLLNKAVENDSFEMEPYEEAKLMNLAHRVIYKDLYQKFDNVLKGHVSFCDSKANMYREAIEKYKMNSQKE